MWNSLWRNLRYSLRMVTKRPALLGSAVLTLTLGIGANTGIFTVINALLLQPLPYLDPEQLVVFRRVTPERTSVSFSPLNFHDLVKETGIFSEASAIDEGTTNLTGAGDPQRIESANVSWNFFRTMKVSPSQGRAFVEKEGIEGSSNVVVISHGLWQGLFGGQNNTVGRSILLNDRPHTIIGIAPRGFSYPAQTQLWRPLVFTKDELDASQRGASWVRTIGRLKQDVTFQSAQERFKTVWKRLVASYPRVNEGTEVHLISLHDYLVKDVKKPLLILFAAVGFVLLIACANVTNLLLAQATRREPEIAVRMALGASRLQLVRQFLMESLMLAMISGAAGLILGIWSTDFLIKLASEELNWTHRTSVDMRVLGFTAVCTMIATLIVGIIPALLASSRSLESRLRSGARGTIGGGNRIRKIIAAGEIAVALILLAGAGLLIQSLILVLKVSPGFDSTNVITFEISVPSSRYPELPKIATFFSELQNRIESRPGVQSAGGIFGLPMGKSFSAGSSFEIIGRPQPGPADEPSAGLRVVTADYFRTMGMILKRGRGFTEADRGDSPGVVIISETAAKQYWPNEDPLGKRIRMHVSIVGEQTKPREIVGIVGDVLYQNLDEAAVPDVYIPHAQHPVDSMVMAVKTQSDPLLFVSGIREAIRSLDPNLPVSKVRLMDTVLEGSISKRRFTTLLLAVFAGVALLLAVIGIYGVLACGVEERTQEIGVRMALGAQHREVLRMVIFEGIRLATAGAFIGLFGAVLAVKVLAGFVFGIETMHMQTFLLVLVIIGIATFLSSYIPARRALTVDPITALRYD